MEKGVMKRVIEGAWLYGAFLGFMPPYVFTLITLATQDTFRAVYFLRLMIAIVIGALVGGYSASFAVKYAQNIMKKPNLLLSLVLGIVLGAICGAITLGITPLTLLISSTDVAWAIMMIKRLIIVGAVMGAVGGAFFGVTYNHFLKG